MKDFKISFALLLIASIFTIISRGVNGVIKSNIFWYVCNSGIFVTSFAIGMILYFISLVYDEF